MAYKNPLQYRWRDMVARCTKPTRRDYARYGGRGIRVCERWMVFSRFADDMPPPPTPEHQLDRIDNDRDYEPGNCRWATIAEQRRNTSRTRWVLLNGKQMPLVDAAKKMRVNERTLRTWVREGTPVPGLTVLPKRKPDAG